MVMLGPRTRVVSSSALTWLLAIVVGSGVTLSARDASAQSSRRARLSSDLRQQIESGDLRNETVIITGSTAQITRVAERHGLTVRKWLATAAVLDVPAAQLRDVADDADVDQMSTNQVLRSQMAVTNETIGADLAQAGTWSEGGGAFTGRGIGVALIDSGVAAMPQLRGRVAARVDFTSDAGSGLDAYGHGTHIAGIIAAQTAARSGTPGVAPGAHIVSLKVLDDRGQGTADNVIEAIDFAIEYRDRFDIKVINLSLGGAVLQPAADDPLCQAVERAYRAGIVVVASAGNFGKTKDGTKILGGVTTPGISPFAITVGALNTKATPWRDDDEVASYSSRGPTRFDLLIKPDLVAPGNKIESLAAPNSTLVREYPELVTGEGASAQLRLSGTSMAAGVVSGAVAVLLEARVGASAFAIRIALQTAASRVTDSFVAAGAGSLDLVGALQLGDRASGVVFSSEALFNDALTNGSLVKTSSSTIVWGADGDTIVWGRSVDQTIVWGAWSTDETIIWGARNDSDSTIVWGTSETIIWGASDTIIWGATLDETIIWGSGVDDTIVSGASADETIIWGASADETIIWGASGDETIVWGASILGD